MSDPVIAHASEPADTEAARELFHEYASELGIDLSFQGFDRELDELPGDYAPPGGCLLVARDRRDPAGCVGLRRRSADTCEMKRLYVRVAYRGTGLGRRLAEAIVDKARELDYERMLLDTLPSMGAARALYATLGFHEVAPYYDSPIDGTHFLALDL